MNDILILGYFDCVHRGHRRLIARAKELAMQADTAVAMLTFTNNPFAVLGSDTLPVYTFEERRLVAHGLGLSVDGMLFDKAFTQLSPQCFLGRIDVLSPKGVVCGHDYRFGYNRLGDADTIKDYCTAKGIAFDVIAPYTVDGERVSSSRIRRLLAAGDVSGANVLLGDDYLMLGEVVKGDGIGRRLGFCTANIVFGEKCNVGSGVYGGYCIVDGIRKRAAVHIGARPTLDRGERRIEVHILDFDGVLYGDKIEVRLTKRLRDVMSFDSTEALTRQIARDCEAVKND